MRLSLALALMATLVFPQGHAETSELPAATDLQADGRLATTKQAPILLVFTASHCPYCVALEADQLQPMMINRRYDDRVVLRTVHRDSSRTIIDFNGRRTEADALAKRYAIRVTPTMVFVDAQGNPLVPAMVGYNTPELFGGYLEETLNTSLTLLRGKVAANRRM